MVPNVTLTVGVATAQALPFAVLSGARWFSLSLIELDWAGTPWAQRWEEETAC